MPRRSAPPGTPLLAIDPVLLYSARDLRAAAGIGDFAWSHLKNRGKLRVVSCSGREFVRGEDLISAMQRADELRREAADGARGNGKG